MAANLFPTDGGSEDTWGALLTAFFKYIFRLSGTAAGTLAIVCNEGQVVTNENQVVTNSGA